MQTYRFKIINLQYRGELDFKNLVLCKPFFNKPHHNKPRYSSHIKSNSVFLDWPHINDMILDVKQRIDNNEILWECDYSFIISGILPYYYHTTVRSAWVITPEFNHLEGNHPDYTIFNISTNPYTRYILAVVEVKSRTGDSWFKLLEQMWDQADVSKNSDGKFWAIGVKGLEICVFRFDVVKFQEQNPDCFTNYEPLNLHNLNSTQLYSLGVKYEECDDNGFARIALIKSRLDNSRHQPYINHMLQYTMSRLP